MEEIVWDGDDAKEGAVVGLKKVISLMHFGADVGDE